MKDRRRVLSLISKNKDLSAFEKSVYVATVQIPRGQVRSYKWIACKIGHRNASRAVGNALNKNPYMGIVPCHRVIKSDGSIGGFARGAAVKIRMLKAEGVDVRRPGLL